MFVSSVYLNDFFFRLKHFVNLIFNELIQNYLKFVFYDNVLFALPQYNLVYYHVAL